MLHFVFLVSFPFIVNYFFVMAKDWLTENLTILILCVFTCSNSNVLYDSDYWLRFFFLDLTILRWRVLWKFLRWNAIPKSYLMNCLSIISETWFRWSKRQPNYFIRFFVFMRKCKICFCLKKLTVKLKHLVSIVNNYRLNHVH